MDIRGSEGILFSIMKCQWHKLYKITVQSCRLVMTFLFQHRHSVLRVESDAHPLTMHCMFCIDVIIVQ